MADMIFKLHMYCLFSILFLVCMHFGIDNCNGDRVIFSPHERLWTKDLSTRCFYEGFGDVICVSNEAMLVAFKCGNVFFESARLCLVFLVHPSDHLVTDLTAHVYGRGLLLGISLKEVQNADCQSLGRYHNRSMPWICITNLMLEYTQKQSNCGLFITKLRIIAFGKLKLKWQKRPVTLYSNTKACIKW